MTTFSTRMFGTVPVEGDGAYRPRVPSDSGRTRTPSLFVGRGLGAPLIDRAAALLDGGALEGLSRDAIAADFARGVDGQVAAFVAFHLEELDADVLRTLFGATDVPPEQTLAHLELVGVAVHAAAPSFSLVLDYAFSKAHSDQLLAVAFDDAGHVVRVSHES